MRRAPGGPLALLLILAATAASVWAAVPAQDEFPHEMHARLFPLCIGCHEGIPAGDSAAFYPEPQLCAGCHDGARVERVEWAGPTREVTNLKFSHPRHEESVGEEQDCGTCHTPAGAQRMTVRLAVVGQCLACHGHPARDHYGDARCETCHVPLARTRFTLARVQALPLPADHRQEGFLAELHGDSAARRTLRCATCHTRELCTSCHVDAEPAALQAQLTARQAGGAPAQDTARRNRAAAVIARIPAAAGTPLTLPSYAARYPVPPSHLQPDFLEEHGERAARESCSTCHTRESCQTCHQAPLPRVVAQLPGRAAVTAPGVVTAMRAPASHASPSFLVQHGVVAAGRPESCSTCHAQASFCQSCHQPLAQAEVPAPRRETGLRRAALADGADVAPARLARGVVQDTARGARAGGLVQLPQAAAAPRAGFPRSRQRPLAYHPPNFAVQHSAAAYGRRTECQSCHNTQVFCRNCHEEMGFGAVGRLGLGFHDAQPQWLLRHGQAARQSLESCSTCHRQTDCMQCHSQRGSFQISPHGKGFDAARAHKRNPQVCRACHFGNPLEGGTP